MSFDKRRAAIALRAVAATAEKLADDIETGRLWPGEYEAALAQIGASLRSVPRHDGQRY